MTSSRKVDSHPVTYDIVVWPMEIAWFSRWRKRLLSKASGNVLEIGSGTGVNLKYYPETVECVMAVDPSRRMITRLERRATVKGWEKKGNRCLKTDIAYGEDLPFEDESFDYAVITLILCSVKEPPLVVDEAVRTLKRGGKILFMEHQLPKAPSQRSIFKWITPVWYAPSGCRLDRSTEKLVRERDDLIEISFERRGPVLGYPFFLGIFEKS